MVAVSFFLVQDFALNYDFTWHNSAIDFLRSSRIGVNEENQFTPPREGVKKLIFERLVIDC